MSWNPGLYLRHAQPRLRPAIDLLSHTAASVRTPEHVSRVFDIGCGPGNITPYICKTFPFARVDGVDSSASMLEKAKASVLPEYKERVTYVDGDIENVCRNPVGPYDVVYSNSAFHWIADQRILRDALTNAVRPDGGLLAVQMPDTRVQPSHTLMVEAAEKCGFSKLLVDVRIPRVEHGFDYYHSLLQPLCGSIEMWSTEYVHELEYSNRSKHPVLEFTSATGLQPILAALSASAGGQECVTEFLDMYNQLLHEAYPPISTSHSEAEGSTSCTRTVLFPFKRFFLVASRL
mmetsp:Transcript_19862/g.28554  ORF Transcript_19862/g.28554 Transcript_19862/m.28554 type:complete len:290 (+) Transcript_19862:53-922(+)